MTLSCERQIAEKALSSRTLAESLFLDAQISQQNRTWREQAAESGQPCEKPLKQKARKNLCLRVSPNILNENNGAARCVGDVLGN
jgi:hypothetical protein